ncbi:MAG: hypothetical protein GY874_00265 [Desulfobacteraceae bacterium]|nr:hypothetical protein [Desulfobacteraceae bacterium]
MQRINFAIAVLFLAFVVSLASGPGKMAITKKAASAYPDIHSKVKSLAKNLMELPDAPVWIHKKALNKLLKMPQGDWWGQRHGLTCIVMGIQKGWCSNKKAQYQMTGYSLPNFAKEKSGNHISFQKYGKPEPFSGGETMTVFWQTPGGLGPGSPSPTFAPNLRSLRN